MIPIDTIVSIKSGDEYGGKYTGKLGIIKKFTDDRVGVEFAGLKNHASKYGLFWFKKENVTRLLASGGLGKSEKYLVDELQMMLSAMNVEAATVDCDCIEVLRGQQKEGL